jgi:hypothetical protein
LQACGNCAAGKYSGAQASRCHMISCCSHLENMQSLCIRTRMFSRWVCGPQLHQLSSRQESRRWGWYR